MSTHRRTVRPRYGRIAALAASVAVSAVTALGGLGVLATGSAQAGTSAGPASYLNGSTPEAKTTPSSHAAPDGAQVSDNAQPDENAQPDGNAQGLDSAENFSHPDADSQTALPADTGSGRRIVFSQSRQRVWLMGEDPDDVQRTYLVSGSVTHNLQPGTYSVYSRSRWAVGVDDSGVMQYFVRFTHGPTGAAIGFHSIPTKNGVPLQTRAQLGTPESHGCIRQYLPDALALWDFAPVGTKVVVVT